MSIKKAVTRTVAAMVVAVCAFTKANAATNFYEYVEAKGWGGMGSGYQHSLKTVVTFKGMYVTKAEYAPLFAAYATEDRAATRVILKGTDEKSILVNSYTKAGQSAALDNIVDGLGCVITGVVSNPTHSCVINGRALDMSSKDVGANWGEKITLQGGNCTTRLYYLTISEDGQLLHDYRPCTADGVSGYYDLVTGKFGTKGTYGSLTAGGNRLYRLTATVVPADVGSIVGPQDQFVSAEETPAVLKAVPANEKCVFEGWRYAGATEMFSTEPELQLSAPTADASVEAVFSMKKIAYAFDLGDAGVFTENGQSTITVKYDYGVTPALPAYTLNEGCYFQRWNRAVPATVGAEDLPFVAVAVTPETKVIRVDPAAPSTGEGKTWATALNSFEDAADLAKHCSAEVWLAGGTNKLAAVVSLWDNAVIRGGFVAVDGPSDAEQLAARDGVARPSALETASGNTTGLLNQKTALQGVQTLDGLTLVQTVGKKTFECTVTAQVDFTNCHFTARGTAPPLALVNCASSANSTFRFFDCRVTNLSSTSSGYNGYMDFRSGSTLVFDRCRFEGNSTDGHGVVNTGGAAATFTDCVFLRNSVAYPIQGKGVACVYGSNARFSRCRFLSNKATNATAGIAQFQVMQDCLVLSNTVTCTGTGTDEVNLLTMGSASSSRLLRTTIAGNVIERNQPDLAAGSTVWSYIISPASAQNDDAYRAYVNLTIAKNRVEATLAEGVTHEVATLVWGGASNRNAFGGAVNCTFYDNDVTAEIVDRSSSKNLDIYLFNSICWNDRTDYRPLWSHTPGTTRGFRLYDCILKNYSADTEKIYDAVGVSVEDPLLKSAPQVEVGGQWTFPLAKWSKSFHWGRRVQENANLVFQVPTVEVAGASWFAKYYGWNAGTQQTAPFDTDITDICGRVRPVDRVVIGSTQEYRPRGLAIILR